VAEPLWASEGDIERERRDDDHERLLQRLEDEQYRPTYSDGGDE
jgi:hypothetical protein